MIVSVVQNKVYKEIEKTKKEIERLLEQADLSNTDLLMFPEMFLCPYDNASFKAYQIKDKDPIFDWLRGLSKTYDVCLVAGTMPVKDGSNLFNRSYVFDKKGRELVHYDKTHLFKVVYPSGRVYDESEVLAKGEEFAIFDTVFGPAGLLICFDVRFPEMVSSLATKGAKVLFLPAQFNTYTGPLHWKTTMQSRAIDHQMYVVAASTARDSFGDYEPYGHSMVVDPYGEVIKEVGEEACLFTVELDKNKVEEIRTSIPILKNRRPELY